MMIAVVSVKSDDKNHRTHKCATQAKFHSSSERLVHKNKNIEAVSTTLIRLNQQHTSNKSIFERPNKISKCQIAIIKQ
jgi:hypothetical protein